MAAKVRQGTGRTTVPKRCAHPDYHRHAVAWGAEVLGSGSTIDDPVISQWCDLCGSLWERYGWEGQRSKWRAPEPTK
jgi:hypothetical protein